MLRIFDIKRFAVHDGPGIRTTAFFKGCPLECSWCHNPESISMQLQLMWHKNLCNHCDKCIRRCPSGFETKEQMLGCTELMHCSKCTDACDSSALIRVGRDLITDELIDQLIEDEVFHKASSGGVTLSGGEPLYQGYELLDLAKGLKDRNIDVWLDTSGYGDLDLLEALVGIVDGVLFDIKHHDPDAFKKWTGGDLEHVLDGLDISLASKARVIVRWPLIGGVNDSWTTIERMIELFKRHQVTEVTVVPYHSYGAQKREKCAVKMEDQIFYTPQRQVLDSIVKKCLANNMKCAVEE